MKNKPKRPTWQGPPVDIDALKLSLRPGDPVPDAVANDPEYVPFVSPIEIDPEPAPTPKS